MTDLSNSPNPDEDGVDALLRRVGDKVRVARQKRGLPRRVLSDMSGVSPRYLAQLEAGEGNISIGLLQRVARALNHPIEDFVQDSETSSADAQRVSDLFRAAPTHVQLAVLQMLTPVHPHTQRAARVCLVGLRGAGKSTLGARASHRLDVPFVELNREIERESGMPVEEVMALYGQEGYRKLEAQAMDRVVAGYDQVIMAVAGGIVSEQETYDRLLRHFHTIWIKTSPEEHMSRVRAQGDERPMAGNPEAMDQLKSILTSRESLYSQAEAQLETSGRPVEASLKELIDLISARGFLEPACPS